MNLETLITSSTEAIIRNLQSERPDQFDHVSFLSFLCCPPPATNLTPIHSYIIMQGVRQAATLITLLQSSPPPLALPTSPTAHRLMSTIIDTLGRLMELSIHYSKEPIRRQSITSIATAMAQAIVPPTSASPPLDPTPCELEEERKERRRILQSLSNGEGNSERTMDWGQIVRGGGGGGGGRSDTTIPVEEEGGTIPQVVQLAQYAMRNVPEMDAVSGERSEMVAGVRRAMQFSLEMDANSEEGGVKFWQMYILFAHNPLVRCSCSVVYILTLCEAFITHTFVVDRKCWVSC